MSPTSVTSVPTRGWRHNQFRRVRIRLPNGRAEIRQTGWGADRRWVGQKEVYRQQEAHVAARSVYRRKEKSIRRVKHEYYLGAELHYAPDLAAG